MYTPFGTWYLGLRAFALRALSLFVGAVMSRVFFFFFSSFVLLLLALPAGAGSAPRSAFLSVPLRQYSVITIATGTTDWFSIDEGFPSGFDDYSVQMLTLVPSNRRLGVAADETCGTSYISTINLNQWQVYGPFVNSGSCTNIRLRNIWEGGSIDVALIGPESTPVPSPTPTDTPEPTFTPTSTPTDTPEPTIVVTSTPVDTPTPDYPALSYQLQQDNTQLTIFSITAVLALLVVLLFVRR